MPAYDKRKVKGFFRTIDRASNKATRGKAFEGLACYLFSLVPGITITGRNELNTFATEEIDVACRNEQDPAGLRLISPFFLVECKGWTDPVNSEQVAWFLMK